MDAEPLAAPRTRLAELADLGSTGMLLGWDQQTMMPPGGAAARGEVMATLEQIGHERATAPELGGLLDELEPRVSARPPDNLDGAPVRVARREDDRRRCVPTELAGEIARAAATARPAWVAARQASDPLVVRLLNLYPRLSKGS